MTVRIHTVAYGDDAARALVASVAAAKGGDPLAPVTVVVPSNHVGVAARRRLASGALGPVAGAGVGVAAVTFVTTFRLAELLGAAALAGQGKRPVSTPVLAAAMRAELAAHAGVFAPVAEHPATESALVASYRELRDCSPGALDTLARTSARAAEVVRLHRAVRARLADAWSDEEDLLAVAATVDPERARMAIGALVVYLPQRLTRHAATLLTALAARVPTTVIAGVTGHPTTDAEIERSVGQLGGELDRTGRTAAAPVGPTRTTVLTASDADEEVRAAVRAVVDAARAGTRLDRMAVLHASPAPYARLAHEQLRAAGITTNGAAVVPLTARVAGRTLLGLLALPGDGFRRQDVFEWLTSAPILHDGRWAPTTAWERLSREAAIVSGATDWDHHLLQLAAKQEERAIGAERTDEAPQSQVDQARRSATQALELRSFVLGLIEELASAARRPRRWSEHAAWAQDCLHRLLGGAGRRADWDADERAAAERVERALSRLGALDGVEGSVSLEVFARTLEVELEQDLGRVGRFGDGVLVGSVEMGIGLDLDLVVVLGLAEGSFPATVRDDSLLPDRERTSIAEELGLRSARVERQHHQLLAALAGAGRHLLCLPRGDLRRSNERAPSRWVLDLCGALADGSSRFTAADLRNCTEPWVRHVPSFDAGLRGLASPATEQEHRLVGLLADDGDLAGSGDPTTVLGAQVIAARRSAGFTRFDGNLAGLPVPSPLDRITSPTRLERWADCPHRHLVEDLLGAPPIENPEDTLVITPIDKGNLVHEALETFLDQVLGRPEAQRPAPGQPWTPDDVVRLGEIGAALCDRYEALGLTGRPIFWRRDRRRILADLASFLSADSRHRIAHGTAPLAAELSFGFGDGHDAVEIELPDHRVLRVRGRIDRIDQGADGTVHVTDYKTGSFHDGYKALVDGDPVGNGTKLQLPIYGLAGRRVVGDPDRPVRADYWFVTGRADFGRAGYAITDDVLSRTIEVVDTIVRGIEDGVFPPHPPALSTFFRIACRVCDPDGLGTAELRRQWDRKRLDPVLARYANLAEPPETAAGP